MPAIQIMNYSHAEAAAGPADAPAAKPQKLKGIQNAFSNYMQQNSFNTAQSAKQQAAVPQAKPGASCEDGSSVQQQYEQYQNKTTAQSEKVTDASQSAGTDTEAVNGAVEEAVEDIKEMIKENLGVDDSQIEAAMELLGLTSVDLLNPQQLIALAVELTGSEDAGMMLFQENFQSLMQDVSAVTEDLLQDLGMTMDELMEQVTMAGQEAPAGEAAPEVIVRQEEAPAAETAVQEPAQAMQAIQEAPEKAEGIIIRKEGQPEQPQEVQMPQEGQPKVQEEVPKESTKGQDTQQGQQETPDGGQEAAGENPGKVLAQNTETPQEARFDFHADAHPQAQNVNVQAPQEATVQSPLPQVNMQDVMEQIVQYTRVNLSEDVKSIEMQLNPENLGKVYLHVTEKQGTVTAQLTAQNETIKEALIQQAAILKENLNQQGVKVDAVEVTVGTHEFENNLERDAHSEEEQARQQEEQNARRSRRSINLNDLNGLDGLSGLMSEEEALAAQIMRDNGNNVDYKA